MAVRYNGPEGIREFKLRVKPGPEGLAAFKAHLKQLLGFEVTADFDVQFECQLPATGSTLTLSGLNAYGAATHCAAIVAANKQAAKGQPAHGSQAQLLRRQHGSGGLAGPGPSSAAHEASGEAGMEAPSSPPLAPPQRRQTSLRAAREDGNRAGAARGLAPHARTCQTGYRTGAAQAAAGPDPHPALRAPAAVWPARSAARPRGNSLVPAAARRGAVSDGEAGDSDLEDDEDGILRPYGGLAAPRTAPAATGSARGPRRDVSTGYVPVPPLPHSAGVLAEALLASGRALPAVTHGSGRPGGSDSLSPRNAGAGGRAGSSRTSSRRSGLVYDGMRGQCPALPPARRSRDAPGGGAGPAAAAQAGRAAALEPVHADRLRLPAVIRTSVAKAKRTMGRLLDALRRE